MVNAVRRSMSIHVEVLDMLNEQIKKEFTASATYLAMASWADQEGYDGTAKFFYGQSEEEREHGMKIFHYINDMGGNAISPAISAVKQEYSSIKEIFEATMDHEIHVTESINKISLHARKVKDLGTEAFLDWFVKEQTEEEETIMRALDILKIHGDSQLGIAMADAKIKEELVEEQ